jgi:hypothetical protein
MQTVCFNGLHFSMRLHDYLAEEGTKFELFGERSIANQGVRATVSIHG